MMEKMKRKNFLIVQEFTHFYIELLMKTYKIHHMEHHLILLLKIIYSFYIVFSSFNYASFLYVKNSIWLKWEWVFICSCPIFYPSSFGGVNQPSKNKNALLKCKAHIIKRRSLPFFSWIWTRDLKLCWARAKLYWPWNDENWLYNKAFNRKKDWL